MANDAEHEEYLNKQIENLEEETKALGAQMEEQLGISCDFGACVFDPSLDSIELKIEEIQRRKKMLETMRKTIKECEV
jgi:prefoldin subunit 5